MFGTALTLYYDDANLFAPFDEQGLLFVTHLVDGEWTLIIPVVDPVANTVTFTVTELSPFVLATVEPVGLPFFWMAFGGMLLGAIFWVLWRGRQTVEQAKVQEETRARLRASTSQHATLETGSPSGFR